jgi:hypothetical protein
MLSASPQYTMMAAMAVVLVRMITLARSGVTPRRAMSCQVGLPVAPVAGVVLGIDDLEVLARTDGEPRFFTAPRDDLRPADEDRCIGHILDDGLRRAQYALVLALGEHDAPLRSACRRQTPGA